MQKTVMEQKNLKLAVKNFGPIREGEVEFKPLTVFIGPNNSGKSYIAVLLYALILALLGRRNFLFRPSFLSFDSSDEEIETLIRWAERLSTNPRDDGDRLSHQVRLILRNRVAAQREELEFRVQDVLREYFGCIDLSELSYRNLPDFSVDLLEDVNKTTLARVREMSGEAQVEIDMEHDWYDLAKVHFPRFIGMPVRESLNPSEFSFLLKQFWRMMLIPMGMPEGDVCYLPAGRSGLLQGWQLIASLAVGMIGPRIGTQNFEIPSFPGVARDFTQELLSLMPPRLG